MKANDVQHLYNKIIKIDKNCSQMLIRSINFIKDLENFKNERFSKNNKKKII